MIFMLEAEDPHSRARAGILHTAHGQVRTPVFMPVGTAGSVKSIDQQDLVRDIQAQIILANTYHLMLRPGTDVIEKAGNLHHFINWSGPILTDSGGYQIFSLSEKRKITEEGVLFSSHIDGSRHFLTPESAIDIQRQLGADIIMVLDECTPYPASSEQARQSMELTHRWLLRSVNHLNNTPGRQDYNQLFFPIVQGSIYPELRTESAHYVAAFDCPGYAIGGLSVGEPTELMYEMTERVCQILPSDKPRYLMGVGTPVNLLECIALGVDMFDCVIPTRNGRNGMLFTRHGIINIRNEKWKTDFSAIEEGGASFVDETYSKAYLRHLFISKEILAARIATLHNLAFYCWLMEEARRQILSGTFVKWKDHMVSQLNCRL
jgi:queuine tRNA-ribosyltransferase